MWETNIQIIYFLHVFCFQQKSFKTLRGLYIWKPTKMNRDLSNLDISTLVDLLARTTERYTELLAEKNLGAEYDECKQTMQILQREIELRKQEKNPGTQTGVSEVS